jgi:hypothetical protein
MNRIYELAKQADIIKWDELPSGARAPDYESVVKAKKFAELIVRECCDQLVEEGNAWEALSRNPPPGQETNANGFLIAAYRLKEDAVDRVKEHFGVE